MPFALQNEKLLPLNWFQCALYMIFIKILTTIAPPRLANEQHMRASSMYALLIHLLDPSATVAIIVNKQTFPFSLGWCVGRSTLFFRIWSGRMPRSAELEVVKHYGKLSYPFRPRGCGSGSTHVNPRRTAVETVSLGIFLPFFFLNTTRRTAPLKHNSII